MSAANPESLNFLLQEDLVEKLLPTLGKEPRITLCSAVGDGDRRLAQYCALLEPTDVATALKDFSWDLRKGEGRPGFSLRSQGDEEVSTYHRFGGPGRARPLVHYRSFNGAFPPYCELDEEFRHYHNLAEDKGRGLLLSFDDSGREVEVATSAAGEVVVHRKYLLQFLAGTGLALALHVESTRYSRLPITEVPEAWRRTEHTGESLIWHRVIAEAHQKPGFSTLSRILAKVIILPPEREKAGIWPFEPEDDREVRFIIGVDEEGRSVEHASAPDTLDNYFGANPGAAHYLTPVFFRREVLKRYFDEPARYAVSDGRLRCLDLWSCQIDNDLDDHVVVFLGDLGRDLPYEERLHWRAHNVPPAGGISATNFRRSVLSQFVDAEAPDLVFRREYERIGPRWERRHGWALFLAPSGGDAHLVGTVRIPATDEQPEFDEQVLVLTKILVDALNEKELAARSGDLPERAKGIAKLEGFFTKTGFPGTAEAIRFLRDLQELRSTGSGHRKGAGYSRALRQLGIYQARKREGMRHLLELAAAILKAVRAHYLGAEEE